MWVVGIELVSVQCGGMVRQSENCFKSTSKLYSPSQGIHAVRLEPLRPPEELIPDLHTSLDA